jgi:hypothetical protein
MDDYLIPGFPRPTYPPVYRLAAARNLIPVQQAGLCANAIWTQAEETAALTTFRQIVDSIRNRLEWHATIGNGKAPQTREQIIVQEWLRNPVDINDKSEEDIEIHLRVSTVYSKIQRYTD